MVQDAQYLELGKKVELVFYNVFMDYLDCSRLLSFAINGPIDTALSSLAQLLLK